MRSTDFCNSLYRYAREQNGSNLDIELNGVPVLLIQRHEEADHILRVRSSGYRKNMDWFRQALGASRFSEDGEAWRVRRALTHDYFTQFDRERTTALACRYADEAGRQLTANSTRGALQVDDGVLRRMAVSVLVENFFGLPFADTGIDLDRIADLMEYGSAYSFVPAGRTDALYGNALRRLPALRRQVLQDLQIFRSSRVPAGTMLTGMLQADSNRDTGVVLEHELLTFFAAGAETSAATVGWALYLLALYPDVQERLRARARELAPRVSVDGWRALSEFGELATLISETLRLYPPTPIIARLAIEADQIDGRTVAPGQNVLISFVGIQHDARHRAEPWTLGLDEQSRRGPTAGSNTAFSFGPRICGGKQFALTELMAFLHTLLLRVRFETTSLEPPRFHWKSQMLREGGQPVRCLDITA
ncbi:cytochrome P450 [Dyella amyloliquefaciens]|uniref:cytochrome P450 n=1 Tax=Dyella amyloliquefaciens TaxID=1770545 RepID=UPI00102E40B6|nr:cytochrome P450 [Dyella amyloliquefaciens]